MSLEYIYIFRQDNVTKFENKHFGGLMYRKDTQVTCVFG